VGGGCSDDRIGFGCHSPETGIGYISQYLIDRGYDYDVLDMSLGYSFDDLEKKIQDYKPDLIGFSFKSFLYKDTYDIITNVKKTFPELTTVIGGAHSSVFRENALKGCSAIDSLYPGFKGSTFK